MWFLALHLPQVPPSSGSSLFELLQRSSKEWGPLITSITSAALQVSSLSCMLSGKTVY